MFCASSLHKFLYIQNILPYQPIHSYMDRERKGLKIYPCRVPIEHSKKSMMPSLVNTQDLNFLHIDFIIFEIYMYILDIAQICLHEKYAFYASTTIRCELICFGTVLKYVHRSCQKACECDIP